MLLLPLLLTPWAACASTGAEGTITSVGASRASQLEDRPGGSRAADQAWGDEHAFITVRELMRLESEQALAEGRQRRGQSPQMARPSMEGAGRASQAGAGEDVRLVGIYGVGKRLFAEVRSGSQAWLFLNGHSLPVGHTADAGLYRLREVAGACVRLERQSDETVLCLPRAGRQ